MRGSIILVVTLAVAPVTGLGGPASACDTHSHTGGEAISEQNPVTQGYIYADGDESSGYAGFRSADGGDWVEVKGDMATQTLLIGASGDLGTIQAGVKDGEPHVCNELGL